MKYTKAQLMKLRGNTDALLKRMENDEKDSYKKLALAFSNSQTTIDKVLATIQSDKTYDKLAISLSSLKKEIGDAIRSSQPDMDVVTKSLDKLSSTMSSKREFSDEAIIRGLTKVEKLLKKPKTKDRTDEVVKAIKNIKLSAKAMEFPEHISIDNFPPQKIPQPATHMSINSLSGSVHQSTTTVKATLTTLPGYGVLEFRRAIVFQNVSSDTDIYIGGSTVTTNDGYKLEAGATSPSFDSGPQQRWYGVTSSGTADIRTLEIPDEDSGR